MLTRHASKKPLIEGTRTELFSHSTPDSKTEGAEWSSLSHQCDGPAALAHTHTHIHIQAPESAGKAPRDGSDPAKKETKKPRSSMQGTEARPEKFVVFLWLDAASIEHLQLSRKDFVKFWQHKS